MKNCPKCNETLLNPHLGCPVCNIELLLSTAQKEAPDLVILCTVLNEAKAHIMGGFLEKLGNSLPIGEYIFSRRARAGCRSDEGPALDTEGRCR